MIQTLGDARFSEKKISVDVLRLDLSHPEISGNKSFKLKYYLAEAQLNNYSGVVSCGGPYSNHLIALAAACREKRLASAGIIRGELPRRPGPSLIKMKEMGMQLIFTKRSDYRNTNVLSKFVAENPGYFPVDEGGAGDPGVKGASEIMQFIPDYYSDVVCAVGTGTTMAGLIAGSRPFQRITGICILKTGDNDDIEKFVRLRAKHDNFVLSHDFHGGGYAKADPTLFDFMNKLYHEQQLPTDFVYTAKLLKSVYTLADSDYFPPGSRVMIVHSGGLQGNRSLREGVLDF